VIRGSKRTNAALHSRRLPTFELLCRPVVLPDLQSTRTPVFIGVAALFDASAVLYRLQPSDFPRFQYIQQRLAAQKATAAPPKPKREKLFETRLCERCNAMVPNGVPALHPCLPASRLPPTSLLSTQAAAQAAIPAERARARVLACISSSCARGSLCGRCREILLSCWL